MAGARRKLAGIAALMFLVSVASTCAAANDVAGELIVFNDNGAWSWFEDERAIVDTVAGKILVSSVAHGSGAGGASRHGDIDIAALDLATGNVSRFVLHAGLQADDHNSAALWIRPDGRYLASYSRHGSDQLTRWRISTNPTDSSSWGLEQTRANGAGTTYSNLHYLPNDNGGGGRLYNFVRSVNFDPNILVSTNLGTSFSYGGKLLTEGSGSDRPYLRYFSDGQRIHFIATERHPRNYDNSIYHGYVQNGQLFNSVGTVVDASLFDAAGVAPDALTPIFTTGTPFGGVTMRRAWTVDVAIDQDGLPYAVFQARANDLDTDHRFFYARFNGISWNVHELAKAGGYLYSPENDYTGLVALDPSDPNRLFISSKTDPRTDITMPHYEIFEGTTSDDGASWSWQPITFNSTIDNLRPIVPKWDDEHTALLWLRGTYSTYTDYNLSVVGLTEIGELIETLSGDLNGDGTIDLDDYKLFLAGMHSNLTGLSFDEAYRRGDLNGDFVNDFRDLVLFRAAYEAANGAGAFVALSFQVPEVRSLRLALLAAPAAMLWRWRVASSELDCASIKSLRRSRRSGDPGNEHQFYTFT
jgi:hypothetical protein